MSRTRQYAFLYPLKTRAQPIKCMAVRRREFRLNESILHVVLRTAKQRPAGGRRPCKGKVRTVWYLSSFHFEVTNHDEFSRLVYVSIVKRLYDLYIFKINRVKFREIQKIKSMLNNILL